MYHVEIRQFPHNAWRFNLADSDLPPIVFPWVREHAVDFGERKWSPHTASITILEGPQLEVQQLTMGRGWQAAQRVSEDVTERLLEWAKATDAKAAAEHSAAERAGEMAEAAETAAGSAAGKPEPRSQPQDRSGRAATTAASVMSDPLALGVQIAALLGPEPSRLLEAWRAVVSAAPDLSPSDALARAEAQLRSP